MGTLVSVNVGLSRDIDWRGEIVRTAIWKQSVQGSRMVRRLNIEGDGQGDLAGHGGEHRAVMVYQIESYRYWQDNFGLGDLAFGHLSDNSPSWDCPMTKLHWATLMSQCPAAFQSIAHDKLVSPTS